MSKDNVENNPDIRTINNPQRGCGFLKENSMYIHSELSVFGALPAFVLFEKPIPYLEPHFRGYKQINGLQFEIAVGGLKTETDRHIELTKSREIELLKKSQNFGELKSPYAFDLLMWVGETFYKTVEMFVDEVMIHGLNKKIPPFEPPIIMLGITKVYLIHPNACGENKPGIFGYSYLTNIIYTVKNESTPVSKHIKDMSKLNRIEIVKIGEQENINDPNQKKLKDDV